MSITDDIKSELTGINASQLLTDGKIQKINEEHDEIFNALALYSNEIILKILDCCNSGNEKRIQQVSGELNQILKSVQDIKTKSEEHNVGLDKSITNLKNIKNLLQYYSNFIKTMNCKNCTDEQKINSISVVSNHLAKIFFYNRANQNPDLSHAIISKINSDSPSDVTLEYTTISNLNLPEYEIATLIKNKLLQKYKLTSVGGRRYRRKISCKRPRKRRGRRSATSKRAAPRRTRKYRAHKYAR